MKNEKTNRKKFQTGAPWENIVGYSRAVLVNNRLEVSGTVASNGNGVVGKNNPYEQAKYIFQKIEPVLEEAGFTWEDVVRTRIFITDIAQWEEVGRAHGEIFKDIKPATSMLEVSALIHPDYLVEIEVSAEK